MRFRVLGPLEIDGVSGPVNVVAQRQLIILMMMLIEANRVVPVDRLIEAVWHESPPATARGQVQICVSALRKIFADADLPDIITTSTSGYMCRIDSADLDLHVFDDLTRSARKASGEGRLAEADDGFVRALGLWRGTAITSGNSRILEGVEVRLLERRASVVEEWADVRLRLGLNSELISDLSGLVSEFPLREGLRAKLMLALYRSGRQAEALEVYRTGRRVLVDELGIEPGEELRRVEKGILAGDPDLDISWSGSAVAASSVPAFPVAQVTPRLLPAGIPDFTGLQETVEQMRTHLMGTQGREPTGVAPVAISGKAGVGKTTLAIHVGHELTGEFPDGQLFVTLNGLAAQPVTASQVLERFLRAMGIHGKSIPEGVEERAEMYRQCVADRRILVILDDAADEEQVQPLLPGSPTCAVIVTSRFRLTGMPGTHIEVGILDNEDAMKMLVKVVGSARVYAELAESLQLVSLCGGLPMALRIAAARLAARPHWSVAHLTERLAKESQRLDELEHHGLGVRANLALTYEVLTEPARRLFRLLGLVEAPDFPGWVASPLLGTAPAEAEEALDELADAQFVDVDRLGQGPQLRYRLHDLIRAYARDRLVDEESPDSRGAAGARLLGAWLFLMGEAHRREYGGHYTLLHGQGHRWPLPDGVVARELHDPLEWYERERLGITAAVGQAAVSGLHELCWDLAMTAVTLFEVRNYFQDWRTTHEIALGEVRRAGNRRGEAAILYSLGTLSLYQQRFDEAAQRLAVAEQAFKELGDGHGYSLVLRNLAFIDRVHSRYESAESRCQEALGGLRAAGDQIGEAHTLSSLAQISIERCAWDSASELLNTALELVEANDARRVRAQILCRLGEVQLRCEDFPKAVTTFTNAISTVRDYGDQVGEVYALRGLGMALARQGDASAERHLLSALTQATYIADRMMIGRLRLDLGHLYLESKRPQQALEVLKEAAKLFGALALPVWQSRTLQLVSEAYVQAGQHDAARMAAEEARITADALPPSADSTGDRSLEIF